MLNAAVAVALKTTFLGATATAALRPRAGVSRAGARG